MSNSSNLKDVIQPIIYDDTLELVRVLEYVSWEIKGLIRKTELSSEILFCVQLLSGDNYRVILLSDNNCKSESIESSGVFVLKAIYGFIKRCENLFDREIEC